MLKGELRWCRLWGGHAGGCAALHSLLQRSTPCEMLQDAKATQKGAGTTKVTVYCTFSAKVSSPQAGR